MIQYTDLPFPKAGIDRSLPFGHPMPKEMDNGEYGAICQSGANVRGFENAGRLRGGSRPGLSRYVADAVVAGWVLQELQQITYTGTPGDDMQNNSSGRIVNLVAVSQGNVYYATSGGSTWTAATNNTSFTPPLNTTGIVRSAVNGLKLWFADGVHWCYYDPSDNTVRTWTATTGELPEDGSGNAPRLIATWRGRTILSGLLDDPQNWFMSAVDVPTDFNYSTGPPLDDSGIRAVNPKMAVAGNNSTLGLVGDVITALVPYSDDLLVFGGDHSIYLMRGDPMDGGRIDLISDKVGMAWGIPWCKDPFGTLYFFSNRTGIYSMIPGQSMPVRISQAIEQLLDDVDTGENTIRMVWSDRFQGLHVFVTPTAQSDAATHFFYEQRTGAWWTDTFANDDHNPLCCLEFDGNLPTDRVALIGSWDGFVRALDPEATDDDGYNIASSVTLGPVLTADMDDMLLKDLQAELGESSGDVSFEILVGRTAEAALDSDPVLTGSWTASRNRTNHVRRAGHAVYVKITATNPWSLERVRALIEAKGKVRKRGF